MATTIAIVSAAAAVASAGVGAAQAAGAFTPGAGGGGAPQYAHPRPRDEKALDQYMGRVLALNLGQTGPTFQDFINSGGTASFDLQLPQFTPAEATALGFTDQKGRAVPGLTQSDLQGLTSGDISGMTPEQLIFLGQQRARRLVLKGKDPNVGIIPRLGIVSNRIDKLQGKESLTNAQQRKLDRLQTKQANLLRKAQQPRG